MNKVKKPKAPKSFNDRMMLMVGVPVVLAWVGFACLVIWSGLHNDKILDNIDGYTTLIAIIGGPALLILTSFLELWKSEQQAEIIALPEAYAEGAKGVASHQEHNRKLEILKLEHAQALEAERQKVDLHLVETIPSPTESESPK